MSVVDIARERWKRQKHRATLLQPCPAKSCAAKPGRPCRNRAGLPVAYFHVGRQNAGFRAMPEDEDEQ